MENPREEIRGVILLLTSTPSLDLQKRAVERFMTPDVAFRHPVCAVESGPSSRKTVLGIYQCVFILSLVTLTAPTLWTKGGIEC